MKTPERDLSLLLTAVFDPAGPTPALLVRYVDDPESLTDAERAEVEDAVSADPLLAGELRTLQSFRAPAPHSATPGPRLTRLRAGFWASGLLAAAAAAALLAVLCRPDPYLEHVSSPTLVNASARPRSTAQVTLPAPAAEPPAAPPGSAAMPIPEPVATTAAPKAPRRAPDPVDASVVAPSLPEASRDAPAPSMPAEPVVLALLEPQYQPPPDAPARYRSAGGTRAARAQGAVLDLEVLAPAHVALTRSATPSLFWSLDPLPTDSITFHLTLSAAMTPEPVLELELPRPERAGLQRIRLASSGVELEIGVEYTWTITADVAGSRKVAQGWIQRTHPSAEPSAPSALPGELPAYYAAAGFWYDAVEALADLADQHPDEERIASALRALALQAQLEPN